MDSSTLQTLIVFLVLAAALLYLGLRIRRTVLAARKPTDGGCGAGCGCGDGH